MHRLSHFAIEVLELILFTLLWDAAEPYIAHSMESFVGVLILQRMAHNYIHSQAHHWLQHGISAFQRKTISKWMVK